MHVVVVVVLFIYRLRFIKNRRQVRERKFFAFFFIFVVTAIKNCRKTYWLAKESAAKLIELLVSESV